MSNRYVKKFLIFNVKAGTEINHELYGVGKVVASYPVEGVADVQFSDGHIEYGFDIKSQVKPEVIETEMFTCPITGDEVLAERCACIKDGIHACDYFKTDLEKKESSCIYESEMQRIASEKKEEAIKKEAASKKVKDAVKEMKNLLDKLLKEAKFEDVLGPAPEGITAKNEHLYVQHRITGAKGKVEKAVSDNAVVVNWKNQEEGQCPCQTVVTGDELVPDNEAKLWCKIKETQEKLKKKFVKPVSEFFKKKKASVESDLIKIDADKILSKMSVMSDVKKQGYLQALKAQLNSLGIDVEDKSVVIDSNGEIKSYNVIKASNDNLYPEYIINVDSKKVAQKLGYDGDILKIYASLKSQLSTQYSEDNVKDFIETDLSKDDTLKTLF